MPPMKITASREADSTSKSIEGSADPQVTEPEIRSLDRFTICRFYGGVDFSKK
jgi:hypothetical protein